MNRDKFIQPWATLLAVALWAGSLLVVAGGVS
jgi:hypothetical protein